MSPFGEVEHPCARPDRDEIGHLMLAHLPWVKLLLSGNCHGIVQSWGGRWSAFERDGRVFARLDYRPFRLGVLLDRMLGNLVEDEPEPTEKSWTWELYETDLMDANAEPMLLGVWPD